MASGEAVANEPRLFVGQVSLSVDSPVLTTLVPDTTSLMQSLTLQIPADCTEEDLWPLFSPFGECRALAIAGLTLSRSANVGVPCAQGLSGTCIFSEAPTQNQGGAQWVRLKHSLLDLHPTPGISDVLCGGCHLHSERLSGFIVGFRRA